MSSDQEKMEYFFAALDAGLSAGEDPQTAVSHAAEDYAAVFHGFKIDPVQKKIRRPRKLKSEHRP